MVNKILKIEEKLLSLKKPVLQPISHVSFKNEDVLIVCAGFEERASEILSGRINPDSGKFFVIIISYLPFMKDNRFEEIVQFCEDNRLRYAAIVYDRGAPSGIGEKIFPHLKGISGEVYVDISAMSRLLIVQIIVFIANSSFMLNRLSLLYCEALNYPPTEEDVRGVISEIKEESAYRFMFLSSGVKEITVAPELSSVVAVGQPSRLITFPSFNVDQFYALYGDIQPSFSSLIHGIPPRAENRWRTEAIIKLNKIEDFKRKEEFKICTLKYQETIDCLLHIYGKYSLSQRIIVSPIGSKMQAVAVGLCRAFLEDIQIVYPTPRDFAKPQNYTEGVRQVYLLQLHEYSQLQTE